MRATFPIDRTGCVRMVLAAVLVALSASACTLSGDGDGGGDDGSASSCASLVEYRNHMYSGAEAKGFTTGRVLGTATLPPCDDTPNDGGDGEAAPASVTAFEIAGVDPDVAIAVEQKDGDVIFVNTDSGRNLSEIKELIKAS
ncbi:DUF6281 family protein [Streptomyces sp. NBC_00459]|uniref:DUF6281 family protein n=1 Tax=Streptomyces sp. NBC_00459 TaxID=2975749 RepID=UPI002E19382C